MEPIINEPQSATIGRATPVTRSGPEPVRTETPGEVAAERVVTRSGRTVKPPQRFIILEEKR
jgi:hypothetical protein